MDNYGTRILALVLTREGSIIGYWTGSTWESLGAISYIPAQAFTLHAVARAVPCMEVPYGYSIQSRMVSRL
jgi:hypothetical protein